MKVFVLRPGGMMTHIIDVMLLNPSEDEVRITTSSKVIPLELINWLYGFHGVGLIRVDLHHTLGQTEYIDITLTSDDFPSLTLVIVEMIATFFNWDRDTISYTGAWNDHDEQMRADARKQFPA